VADAVVTLRINTDGSAAVTGVRQLAAETDRAAQRMTASFTSARASVQSMSEQLRLARDYVLGFAGLHFGKELIAGIVEANTRLSGFRYGLEAATGSSAAAKEQLAYVRAESDRLGISLEDSAATFVRLAAATKGTALEGEGARKVFTGVAEAARTLHLSGAETQQALTALDQMMSKGTVQAQELKLQLGNVLPGAMHIAADAMGVTTAQLDKMMERGELVAEDFLPKLAARLHELYGATAGEAANSPAAQLERLKNAAFELKAAIGDAGFMTMLASGATALAHALTLVVQSGALDVIVRGLAAVAFGAAAAWAVGALRTWITSMVLARVAIEGAATAQTGLNLAMKANPIGLAVTAIAALYEAYQYLADSERQAAEEQRQAFADELGSLDALIAKYHELGQAKNSGQYGPTLGERNDLNTAGVQALAQAQADLKQKELELADAQAGLNAIQQAVAMGMGEAALDVNRYAEKVATLTPQVDELKARIAELTPEVAGNSDALRAASPLVVQFGDDAAGAAGGVDSFTAGLDAMLASADALNASDAAKAAFDKLREASDRATEKLQAAKEKTAEYREEQERLILTNAVLVDHLDGPAIAALKAQIDAMNANITAADNLGKRHRAAAKDITDSAAEAARAEKGLADMLDSLRGSLGESAKAQSDYNKGMRELQERAYAVAIAGGDVAQAIAQWQEGEVLLKQQLAQTNAEIAKHADVLGNYLAEVADQNALLTMTDREKAMADAVAKVTDGYRKLNPVAAQNKTFMDAVTNAARQAAGANYDLAASQKAIHSADDIVKELDDGPYAKQLEQLDQLQAAIAAVGDANSKLYDPAKLEQYTAAQARLNQQVAGMKLESAGQAIAAGLTSLQKLAGEGTQAYAQMQVAIDAANIAAAIGAIVNQGMGDPYTAFARIAAMAALMATFVGDLGAATSAGFTDTAKQRQESQGTGTVLGDADAKSDSIAKAIDITAKATTTLVGLNRGMLNALQALQNALGAAGNQLARGAGNVDFGPAGGSTKGLLGLDPLGSALTSDPIGGAIGSFLWGGSKKITDQGIVIMGGTLLDMLDTIMVGAYQTVETDGGLFGSNSSKDRMSDVSDTFGRQFQLVIGSIVDTVREGARALGLLPADIEAAIAQFHVEEIRISLKGLSAEDQQKELEAVFSSLFDGLAGAVVPFIAQFQQVGEGLGETLVRIATEVQVAQQAFAQLGLAVDETDPERFAQIADGLIQAAGGLDEFIGSMQSFVSNFAPQSYQFSVQAGALSSALAQVGLSLPATRDGMWELMQSLDATTAQGQQQIAMLLQLAGAADQYYDALDKQREQYAEVLGPLGLLGPQLSEFGKGIAAIRDSEAGALDAADALARAQGREGASTRQIAQIHDWASRQVAAALRRLQTETRDIIAKLSGGIPASLDAINEQISKLEGTAGDTSQISDAQTASNQLFESWKSGIKSVQDYLDSMLLGDLSALTPEEQLAEAKRQLVSTQQAALGGDAEALAKLPQMADAFLRLERNFDASGADYGAQFDWVRQLLGSVAGIKNPGTEGGTSPIAVAVSASPELQALYAARDAALAQQEADYRAQLAQQLVQNLHDLAVATRTPILDMIALQGYALDKIAADMGIDLQNLTGESVLALGEMATTLGLNLTDLTTALGLNLTDLGAGVTELTTKLGIDLGNLTVQSTETLAQLANSLGGDLADLATSVGVDVGKLTDKQSLLNEALADTIDGLPDGTRDQLAPLLEAITDATTEADANSAIQALEDAVNLLAPDIRDQLAPYLSGVDKPDALTDLDYLGRLQDIGRDQLDVLRDIARGLDVPGYAVGTGYVPQTGLALIHQGESIFPAPVASWMRANGFPVAQVQGGAPAANDAMVVELRALRAEVADLRRATADGAARVADTVRSGDARAQSQRDEIARNTRGSTARSTAYG